MPFRLLIIFLGLVASFPCEPAWAAADSSSPMPKNAFGDNPREMNGYTLSQFGDFVHFWHFVTVRFRRDSGEMRFAYANDIAWKALQEGSKDYPDGAVFAKVAVVTNEDPAFIDSAVPSGTQRTQIMVRNHERHKDTDGWGYAIFDAQGIVAIGETQKKTSEACNACHQAVPERGLVFSQIMPGLLKPAEPASLPVDMEKSHVPFTTVDIKTLPKFVRDVLPLGIKTVRQMQGSIPQHVYHGTLAESTPLVAAEVVRANLPAVLIDESGTPQFSAMWPAAMAGTKQDSCQLPAGKNGRLVLGGRTYTLPNNPIEARYRFTPMDPYCSPAGMEPPQP